MHTASTFTPHYARHYAYDWYACTSRILMKSRLQYDPASEKPLSHFTVTSRVATSMSWAQVATLLAHRLPLLSACADCTNLDTRTTLERPIASRIRWSRMAGSGKHSRCATMYISVKHFHWRAIISPIIDSSLLAIARNAPRVYMATRRSLRNRSTDTLEMIGLSRKLEHDHRLLPVHKLLHAFRSNQLRLKTALETHQGHPTLLPFLIRLLSLILIMTTRSLLRPPHYMRPQLMKKCFPKILTSSLL